MSWLAVTDGYEVTLDSGKVLCRNASGKVLRSLPPRIRDHSVTLGLRQLAEWLGRHETQCRIEVERWMVRSLPVPATLLAELWPDEAWRTTLADLVVAPLDDAGHWDPDEVGLLRDAGPDGIGVVNLDGESVRLTADRVLIPHPVLLADLDDLREFAADLDVRQSVGQLFRETWVRPADLPPERTNISEYSDGKFEQLRHLLGRATSLGYPVRGGYAVCRIFEAGQQIEARYWVGADDPSYETETGDLVFTNPEGRTLPLAQVGPVAWSEGMRMAAVLYAGRVVPTNEEEK
ncbi:DUF4132 domain-containing protein [Micromonospora sonneratiae]|uniref:DUF4132 domain-containing protein n=1 Tax=Micromonospora sonneratiae TaxID=1184706 RepID=A0ABW3Y8U0_9ACTN